MSKRFLRWAENWIKDNIPSGANPDIESHEARAKRLTEKMFAEAAAVNFSNSETEEERNRVFAPGAGRGLRQHRFRLRRLYAQVSVGAGK